MKFAKVLLIMIFSGLMLQSADFMANDGESISSEVKTEKQERTFKQSLKSSACSSVNTAVRIALPTALICTALYFFAIKPLTKSMNDLGKDLRSYEQALNSLAESFQSLKDSIRSISYSSDNVAKIAAHVQESTLYGLARKIL